MNTFSKNEAMCLVGAIAHRLLVFLEKVPAPTGDAENIDAFHRAKENNAIMFIEIILDSIRPELLHPDLYKEERLRDIWGTYSEMKNKCPEISSKEGFSIILVIFDIVELLKQGALK